MTTTKQREKTITREQQAQSSAGRVCSTFAFFFFFALCCIREHECYRYKKLVFLFFASYSIFVAFDFY